ncbi:MAG: hypothetical protein E7588_00450 [Ruminococcaceae bacterium]|nr:hypothetical protein [Oscillospiraceae bacterium]
MIPEKYPLMPNNGEKCETINTFLSAFYNEKEIVFTFECCHSVPLFMPYSRYNDPVWRGEATEVFISPGADNVDYFEFDSAPNGASYNAGIHNLGYPQVYVLPLDNCPVRYITNISDGYYTTEVHIPFSFITEHFTCPGDIPWLFNAYRINRDKNGNGTLYAFSPTYTASFHTPSHFACLEFM